MPRRDFKVPFAASGDTSSIPTEAQSDGSVSFTQGFTFDYERKTDGTDPQGKVFPRTPFNGLMNEITASIGEIQQNGHPSWSAGMAPYPINARVRYNDINWISTVSNNSSTPGSGANWANAESPAGRFIGSRTYTTSGTFTYTPSPGTKRVKVTLVGGGGAGGAVASTSSTRASMSQAGSSGATAVGYFEVDFSNISVTVGAGGVGTSGNGNGGGSSSFGTKMSAPGGVGGNFASNINSAYWVSPAASGGTPAGANLYGSAGNMGTSGQVLAINSGGAGVGGISTLGGSIGRGGDGKFNIPSQGQQTGNNGGAGIAVIEEYS